VPLLISTRLVTQENTFFYKTAISRMARYWHYLRLRVCYTCNLWFLKILSIFDIIVIIQIDTVSPARYYVYGCGKDICYSATSRRTIILKMHQHCEIKMRVLRVRGCIRFYVRPVIWRIWKRLWFLRLKGNSETLIWSPLQILSFIGN